MANLRPQEDGQVSNGKTEDALNSKHRRPVTRESERMLARLLFDRFSFFRLCFVPLSAFLGIAILMVAFSAPFSSARLRGILVRVW